MHCLWMSSRIGSHSVVCSASDRYDSSCSSTSSREIASALGEVCLASTVLVAHVVGHPQLQIGHRQLLLATRAAARVMRGEHLVEVCGLKRLARLNDLPRGPQPDLLEPRTRVEPPDQPHGEDEQCDAAEDDHGEGVHVGAVYPGASRRERQIGATSDRV